MGYKFLLLASIICLSFDSSAQSIPNPALSADSLASGSSKDVLKSFFQLAFNKIISNDKEVNFSSNPFAVMARMDTTLLMDRNYYHYRHLRDLNFSFGVKLDSNYKFNGFSSGIKYALINKRDETVSRTFLTMVQDDAIIQEYMMLNNEIEAYISTLAGQPALQKTIRDQQTAFRKGQIKFSDLDPGFAAKIKAVATNKKADHFLTSINADPNYNMYKASQDVYKNLKDSFNQKLLWTVGVSDTTYRSHFFFSNVVLNTEVVKGFGRSVSGLNAELNSKAYVQFYDDTIKSGNDLSRQLLHIEPGINLVFRTKRTLQSFLEFKISGAYEHQLGSVYLNESRDSVTVNGTLRVRLFDDVWIPLEVKYDPKSGNVFGFLNVHANFTGLRKLAGRLNQQ